MRVGVIVRRALASGILRKNRVYRKRYKRVYPEVIEGVIPEDQHTNIKE